MTEAPPPKTSSWRRAKHRVAHSIKLRMVLVFLVLAAAMTFVVVTGAQKAFSMGWREAARPLLKDYVDRLARDITERKQLEQRMRLQGVALESAANSVVITDTAGTIPRGPGVRALDVGVGANCVYPIIGRSVYGWRFVGSDIDPQALQAARANSEANAVRADYTEPDSLLAGTWDVVLANILSNPLMLLAPALLARVAFRPAISLRLSVKLNLPAL